jgi:hypothetical protein
MGIGPGSIASDRGRKARLRRAVTRAYAWPRVGAGGPLLPDPRVYTMETALLPRSPRADVVHAHGVPPLARGWPLHRRNDSRHLRTATWARRSARHPRAPAPTRSHRSARTMTTEAHGFIRSRLARSESSRPPHAGCRCRTCPRTAASAWLRGGGRSSVPRRRNRRDAPLMDGAGAARMLPSVLRLCGHAIAGGGGR